MIKKVLLFDIDGTLLLSGGAGKIAFERAFEELFQVSESWGDCVPDGKTDEIIFQEIAFAALKRSLEEHELRDLITRYTSHFPQALLDCPRFRLMPGVKSLLDVLIKRKDILLGVATGNVKDTSWMKLKHGQLDHYFTFGGFASDSPIRNQIISIAINRAKAAGASHIAPNQFYVIGDTPLDIACAKANQAKSIVVTTGSYSKEELHIHDPDHAITDLSDRDAFLNLLY